MYAVELNGTVARFESLVASRSLSENVLACDLQHQDKGFGFYSESNGEPLVTVGKGVICLKVSMELAAVERVRRPRDPL